MLQLKGVTKTYAKGSVKAVDDLTLNVKRGEIFGFIGPNGAGKTTTIKMIAGILSPDSGSISVAGYDMEQDALMAKRNMGFVPDSHEMYDTLKGVEYINFMADMYQVPQQRRMELLDQYVDVFGMEQYIEQPIKSYSHGTKQKLTIIGALLHEPALWILDEPMTGLDPRMSHILKENMRQHCDKGNTVFFSTHVLEVAEKLCDRIGIISEGKLIAVGTLEELRNKRSGESLENIFLQITGNGEKGGEWM
ncbi:MAG: ABC transporter ATP-binding protein [Christensenellales bacterium]|jgi:ABC-2 type transport system ATP-binding protein